MKDLLQVAARSGSGSAARALGSGLAGMRTSTRRFLIFGGIAVALMYLGWDMFAGITQQPTVARSAEFAAAPQPAASSTPANDVAMTESAPGVVNYAIEVDDISGLAADVPAGTVVDLWVTWDRPITRIPKLQRLLRGVQVQIAPPVTAEGPYVALLSVDETKVDKLLWADQYGSLSATITPGF